MDILKISHLYPHHPESVNGIFVQYQANNLKKRGHAIKVLSPRPWVPDIPIPLLPDRWQRYRTTPTKTTINGIEVFFPRYLSLPTRYSSALVSLFARRSVKYSIQDIFDTEYSPDIINAHTALIDGYSVIPISEQFNIPLVTTIHGSDFHRLHQLSPRRFLIRDVIEKSDAVVVNSSKLLELGKYYFGDEHNFKTVPNGFPKRLYDLAKFTPCPPEINKENFTIITVGALIKSKGHQYIIEAINELKHDHNIELVIIGRGSYRSELESLIAKNDLQSSVSFIGEVPHKNVFKYLWWGNVFALPSYQEAFGIVYLEAMACHLPVIGCKGEGPEDFIVPGENGFLVPPHTVKPIVEILSELANDKKYAYKIGSNAHETVIDSYTWEKNAEKVESIYEEVI